MTLREPVPRLRVINKSNHVAKVAVVVQPGDELEVSEDVAAQLDAQSLDFVPSDHPDAAKAVPYPPVEEADEPAAEVDEAPAPRPRKRSARK